MLRHGKLQEKAFAEPGGEALRRWIEKCPNELYSALEFRGGAAWRKRLLDEIGDQADVSALIERRSDEDLAALMGNLGGHDLETLLDAFAEAGGTTGRSASSPIRSRGSACPSPATRTTMRGS